MYTAKAFGAFGAGACGNPLAVFVNDKEYVSARDY
jgi:hypothetical protein